jgi:hypothetical protein
MAFWKRPKTVSKDQIAEIVIRESCDTPDDPRYLTMDVQNFVVHMLQVARCSRQELPREALLSAAVDYYICTVENGGHDAFIGNSGWDPELRGEIREGLEVLGLDEVAAIFRDLENFARTDPARFEASGWSDPRLQSLDERFNRLPKKPIFDRHAAWLKALSNLKVYPDVQYHQAMGALTPANRTRH